MQLTDSQRAAALALGLNPEILVWPAVPAGASSPTAARQWLQPEEFADEEWVLIVATGALPQEATQAGAMSMRRLVGAVVSVVCSARSWTDLEPVHSPEAVRRRFGRFAHLGVWQNLSAALTAGGSLTVTRASQFASVAHRADSLRRR